MPIQAPNPTSGTGLSAALATAGELREALLKLAQQPLPAGVMLLRARKIIASYEPVLVRSLRDSLLAGWLKAARRTGRNVPIADENPPPLPPPFGPSTSAEPPDEPVIRLPLIEEAAETLAKKRLMLAGDFLQLDQDARRAAFTVARATSLETVSKIHQALVDDIREGGTLAKFRERVDVATSPILSPPQVETLYRTHVMQSYAAGQRKILNNPLVGSEFPYMLWTATHDSRVEPSHLEMETFGLNGTAVYRSDDPMWVTLTPPCRWNCRCHAIPLSIEDAARRGVREAIEWVRTGQPPTTPSWVQPPYPITPPPGWPTNGSIAAVL